jgi:phospholipid/cholesterol/gamma-HCH transport system substrate-binding protein
MASRDAELERLINDANLLLAELERRRDDISRLLDSTAALAAQITALVQENRAELKPTLDRLNSVLALLEENKANLEEGLANMAPFTRLFANVLGTGRWFDTYIQNMVPVPGLPLPTAPAVQP